METTLDSFEVKDSLIQGAGKGVFSNVDIVPDTYLAFKPKNTSIGVMRREADIPKEYIGYCVAEDGGMYSCPRDFNNMEAVWYLNHSTEPNAEPREDGYYAVKFIGAGEEITIDYNDLNEPEDKKEEFYRKNDE